MTPDAVELLKVLHQPSNNLVLHYDRLRLRAVPALTWTLEPVMGRDELQFRADMMRLKRGREDTIVDAVKSALATRYFMDIDRRVKHGHR